MVEVRLDAARDAEPYLDALRPGPHWAPRLLVTLRSRREGGQFDGTPGDAAALLTTPRLLEQGSWFDAEGPVAGLVRDRVHEAGKKVLASFHGKGAHGLPMKGVDAWKVARPVEDGASAIEALEEARKLTEGAGRGEHPPAFVVPYGALGAGLRVVTSAIARASGIDPFVYGLPDEDAPCEKGLGPASRPFGAAGIPRLSFLVDEGRLGEATERPRCFGLIGAPSSKSPSPALHAAVFRSMGLDAVYFPAVDLDPAAAMALPYAGWSVTTPRKEAFAEACDELDDVASRCGAVNTVVRNAEGRLVGSNTDALAVSEAVGTLIAGAGPGALVVGGGGFARAAAVALLASGRRVRCGGSRRSSVVAKDLGLEDAGPSPRPLPDESIVVNATPAGADGVLPVAWATLLSACAPGTRVVDAPYAAGAAPGAVARAARARGLQVEDGPSLLLRQAAGQALKFTGRAPATGVLRCALRPPCNIVLIGPRGTGKTTLGSALARRLGRPFVDTDEELASRAGVPAGRVLETRGEPGFRVLESLEVGRAMARRGAVVAVGGGALIAEGNAALVRERGFAVRLGVAPAEAARRIAADPVIRPRLVEGEGLRAECERLANERSPGYDRVAQAFLDTNGRSLDELLDAIVPIATRALDPTISSS